MPNIPSSIVAYVLNYARSEAHQSPFADLESTHSEELTTYAQSDVRYADCSTLSYLPELIVDLVANYAETDEHLDNAALYLADAMQDLLTHEFTTFDCPMHKRAA